MRGPRVITKTDAESSIGRGCVEYGAHYRPEIAAMTHAACEAAKTVAPSLTVCRKTEGHRAAMPGRRDLHSELRAIDYTFENAQGERASELVLTAIAIQMGKILGRDYDIVVHAVGSDAVHIHCELDPK